jgi:hypothetical protein
VAQLYKSVLTIGSKEFVLNGKDAGKIKEDER